MKTEHIKMNQSGLLPQVTDFPRDFLDLPPVIEELSPMELAASFRKQIVHYPAYTQAIKAVERCHRMGRVGLEEPDCLLITGVSGAGKSTIRKQYAARFPRYEDPDRTRIPVLHLQLPAQPTIKNVAERILLELGDPFAERSSAESKTARIITLLRECRTELVILDEFQHFVDSARGKVDYLVADWLKQIINATRIPFILMGLPRCQQILVVNEQLRRRFNRKISIRPFGIKTKREAEQFIGLLKTLESTVPLPEPSCLSSSNLIKPIYYATAGLIDFLIKLVGTATELAAEDDARSLDAGYLSKAFETVILPGCTDEMNPFSEKFVQRTLNREGEPFHGYL